MIGRTLAHYRITAAIGAGGMGEVWRATDTKLGRDVALKVLPPEFAEDPDRLARFEREAKVLASLNHPNIAHLYGLESVNTRMAAGTAAPQGSQADGKGLVGHASRVPYTDASREAHAPKGVRATPPSSVIPSETERSLSVIPSETERSLSVIPSERSEPRDLGGGSRQVHSGSHPPDSSTPASPGDASARNDRMGERRRATPPLGMTGWGERRRATPPLGMTDQL